MSSKISGMSRSRCFIRSFMAVMMELALSSAPCLEDFSAAPAKHTTQAVPRLFLEAEGSAGTVPPPRVQARYDHSWTITWPDSNLMFMLLSQLMSDLIRSRTSSGAGRS